MKYIKLYENTIRTPKIDDYVTLLDENERYNTAPNIKNFIKYNIGQIIKINTDSNSCYIKYENVPSDVNNGLYPPRIIKSKSGFDYYIFFYYLNNIKYYSQNKEDLEILISQNKYNL